MNILQVIPSLEAGGAERAAVDIAVALKKAGHVSLVASSGGRLVNEIEQARARHIVHPLQKKNPAAILNNARWLAELIRSEKIDVIHARSRAPAWSAWLAARKTGIPFVTTFHAAYKGLFPLKKLYNSIMARGDRIIAISSFIAAHIRSHYHVPLQKIVTIPRGIDLEAFAQHAVDDVRRKAVAEQLKLEKGVPFILMPGRLSPIKGQELVLEALGQMKDMPFVCAFVGPDQGRTSYTQKLKEATHQLGLEKQVRFIERMDLLAAYARADLVLSPSQVAEGFGRVPVEAMAFGIPVIATALGATQETVKEGETGWLVPAGDGDALCTAIRHALSLPREVRLRMSEQAIQHVRARYDVRTMCAETLSVYQSVLR